LGFAFPPTHRIIVEFFDPEHQHIILWLTPPAVPGLVVEAKMRADSKRGYYGMRGSCPN